MAIDILDREEISNKTEIEKLLSEIKNAALGLENYKQFFDRVNNSDQIIMSQIENLVREYREYKVKFDEEYNKDSHKQLVEDGFVRFDVFEDARMMNKILLEAYNWKTLQEELFSILFQKIFRVLDDARALDIKRDALKEMREMEDKRQKMFVDIIENMMKMFQDTVTGKLQTYDEKFVNLVMMMDEDDRRDRKEIFDTLKAIVSNIEVIPQKNREEIIEDVQKEERLPKKNRLFDKSKQESFEPSQEEIPANPRPIRRGRKAATPATDAKMDDIDADFDAMSGD
jgi:hypothetical protein